ncbi:MAG TPA: DUF5666 domain-containing protein [Ktedonobacterales bacterium]|nr:DUF5666 domain-containing protein [Ktedonobacterales bacterium]
MDDSPEPRPNQEAPPQLPPPAGYGNAPPEYGYGYPSQAGYGYAPPSYGYQQPPPPAWPRRRWPLIAGVVLAFALTLGVGAALGSALFANAQAAGLGPGANVRYSHAFSPGHAGRGMAAGQGQGQGQCVALTVSSVNGSTITAKAGDGSTVTIHTTSSTQYRQNGQTVSASAVAVGSRISAMGMHNSDGSITATSIDIH